MPESTFQQYERLSPHEQMSFLLHDFNNFSLVILYSIRLPQDNNYAWQIINSIKAEATDSSTVQDIDTLFQKIEGNIPESIEVSLSSGGTAQVNRATYFDLLRSFAYIMRLYRDNSRRAETLGKLQNLRIPLSTLATVCSPLWQNVIVHESALQVNLNGLTAAVVFELVQNAEKYSIANTQIQLYENQGIIYVTNTSAYPVDQKYALGQRGTGSAGTSGHGFGTARMRDLALYANTELIINSGQTPAGFYTVCGYFRHT